MEVAVDDALKLKGPEARHINNYYLLNNINNIDKYTWD